MSPSPDNRLYAAATQRNREPILEVLRRVLPPDGTVLEVSSGTGEHAIFFAPLLRPRQWLPSDPDPTARASIAAWQREFPADNLHPPIALNAEDPIWPVEQAAFAGVDLQRYPVRAIANINMIHIAPWSACLGLLAGAERILPPGGILYLYGPFKQNDQHTAPSNATFDEMLRMQDATWGVRDLEAVTEVAHSHHLQFIESVPMPANNFSVIFQR